MRRHDNSRRGAPLRIATRLTGLAVAAALALPVVVPSAPASAAVEDPAGEDPIAQAQVLYQEGTTLYSAAEYIQAVEKWTKALDIITKNAADSDQAYTIRGALLLNIAKARVNAYEVDRDAANLRKGRAIYQRFVDEAEQGAYKPEDVAEATREIEAIDAKLDELEAKENVPAPVPTEPTQPVDTGPQRDVEAELAIRKKRGVGIGLLAGGSAVLAGGVAAMIYGSFFETWARDDIRRNDSDPNTTDADEQAYLDSEKQKGRVWMGVGGALAAVGVGGIAGGAVIFVRANRKLEELQGLARHEVRAAPVVSRDFAGLSLSGRF